MNNKALLGAQIVVLNALSRLELPSRENLDFSELS